MRKIFRINFIIFMLLLISENSFSESKLEKIKDKVKNKIKASESKLVGKIWGTRDCSQHSTKTLAGLAKYKRCKSGLKPIEKKSWKKAKVFYPNKPCNEYSTKTFTGLAAKIKCKRAKKN